METRLLKSTLAKKTKINTVYHEMPRIWAAIHLKINVHWYPRQNCGISEGK